MGSPLEWVQETESEEGEEGSTTERGEPAIVMERSPDVSDSGTPRNLARRGSAV